METALLTEELTYDGSQLAPHFARKFGIKGDSILAFIGPCDIAKENIIDIAELETSSKIYSPLMLHFLIEHFGIDLEKAVLRQRIFASLVREQIQKTTDRVISRDGDDLYLGEKKMSVSVATVSPVSALIHFGLNIKTEAVPVPAAGLEQLNIEPRRLAQTIIESYCRELTSISDARCSVLPAYRTRFGKPKQRT